MGRTDWKKRYQEEKSKQDRRLELCKCVYMLLLEETSMKRHEFFERKNFLRESLARELAMEGENV